MTLTKSDIGNTLFVFDNFETVRNPSEVYGWIDTYIRNPNKVLITTRHRDFRGDYPVTVGGMTEAQSQRLIDEVSHHFGVHSLVTSDYRNRLYTESEGHPYVIKVLLGEVAKARQLVKLERIIGDRDDILRALFERTYARLLPASKRVYFTLCNWSSVVPVLGLRAILLRPTNERVDVDGAIQELEQVSFVEALRSESDEQLFLSVPLAAAVFGRSKLQVDPMKSVVEADCRLLHGLGAAQATDIRHGVAPRIERLFGFIADAIRSRDVEASEATMILD